VDPAAILLLTAGAASASSGKWLVTGLILAVGAVAKETTVILLPVAATLLWFDKQRGLAPRLAVLAGLGLCFLLPFVVVRFLNRDVGSHLWLPHLWRMGHNLRPRALLSVLLTFGIPGILVVVASMRRGAIVAARGPAFFWSNLAGCLGGVALVAWSFVSAHTDGRYLWMAYPFAIPLGAATLACLWPARP
jgi:hypothetical protein